MNKTSALFLILIAAMTMIASYEALSPLPAKTVIIDVLGLSAFVFLCASLLIGPLATIWPKSFAQIIEPRRAVGIIAFVLSLAHALLAFALVFGFDIGPFLTFLPLLVSLPAMLVLLILTITSNDYSIKKLGPGEWKTIQRLNYVAFVLSFAHFLLKARGLFVFVNGKTFVDLAELLAVLAGIATVALQIAGFMVRKSKMNAAAPAQAPATGEANQKE